MKDAWGILGDPVKRTIAAKAGRNYKQQLTPPQ